MTARPRHALRVLRAAASSTLLATSCTVGPDFERPASEPQASFVSIEPATDSGATTSRPTSAPADIARWWTVLGDPELTSLIERAAAGNLDLASAATRVRAARARRAILGAAQLPTVDVNAAAGMLPEAASNEPGFADSNSHFAAGFDASWELDVFGGIRRGVEAGDADVAAAMFDLADVQVSLAGEIASTYIGLRAAQSQREIVARNLEAQQAALEVAERRFKAGLVNALDVSNARANLEATRSRLPVFDRLSLEATYALAVLLGQDPGALRAELAAAGPLPKAPAVVPVGVPSELLLRRPDIRRAEAELHAATARVGVAVADQFPRFALSASIGTRNDDMGQFAALATNYWSALGGVTAPIFDGGRIRANIALRQAIADDALVKFRKQVLGALRETETALNAFVNEQSRRDALMQAVDAGRDAVTLANELYSAGRTDFLNVVAAQRALLDNEEALSRSEQVIANNLVAIYKSLGGGWNPASEERASAARGAPTSGS